jgi:hypothetical protein
LRWIQKENNRITKGDTDFPEGDAFFVDETGSKAIINDVLYVDGKRVSEGKHEIHVKDKVLPITINKAGKATRGKVGVKV